MFNYTTDIFDAPTKKYDNKDGEIWKVVPGFSRYEASTFGRLRNKKTKKLMSDRAKDGGYINNSLINDDNKEKKSKRHRIVAQTFIPNINNKPTVNHKNHQRDDNRVSNLEWFTMKEQAIHKRHKKKGEVNLHIQPPIIRCDLNGEKIEEYSEIDDALIWIIENIKTNREGIQIKKNQITINSLRDAASITNNRTNRLYGFTWKYGVVPNLINEIWKEIPNHLVNKKNGYLISSYGRIKYPKGDVSKGYKQANYISITLNHATWRIHRLVAEVFIPKPIVNTELYTQVNHKDTNTLNNCVDNLEWVTPSQNCKHAVIQHKIGIPIKISNIKTGTIQEFTNIPAAAKSIQITSVIIRSRLNSGELYKDEYKFEHLDPKNEKKRVIPNKNKFGNSIKATNTITKEIRIFDSVTDCAKELNIDRRYIDTSITNNRIYISRKTGKTYNFSNIGWYKNTNRTSGQGTSIEVHNLTDNIKIQYKSIKEAVIAEGIDRHAIDVRINNKGGTGGWGKSIDWTFSLIDSTKSLPVVMIDLDNNQKHEFDSITKTIEGLSKILNNNISIRIEKYIAKKSVYLNRFRFEYKRTFNKNS